MATNTGGTEYNTGAPDTTVFDSLEKAMKETIAVEDPTFEESCKILSGEYHTYDGVEVCTIRRGLTSYTFVRRSDGKVEVLAEGMDRLRYVNHIDGHLGTVCYIHTEYGVPVASECVYFSNRHALSVRVYPYGRSVIVSKYGFSGKLDGYVLLSTIGRKRGDYKVMRVSENYADVFEDNFLEKLTEILAKIE